MDNTFLVLLVEDERNLANTLALNLRSEGYRVLLAGSGKDADLILEKEFQHLNLAILDVMLPDSSGFDICARLKSRRNDLPVIFLTAKNMSSDKIEGLKLGADDYITKPFDLEEFLLRVKNLLKRAGQKKVNSLRFKNGLINFSTFEIKTFKGETLTLSRREIGLLELLTSRPNQVVSRDEIISRLWSDEENPSSRTIDNYILNFRKYFERDPKTPEHFFSVRGVGYKFVNE
ncbi:MAG TPA: response regulator transcription factor [Bacteroidia bacterium]|nr:response regulator transcription factor [Bacteroidia bacterium]